MDLGKGIDKYRGIVGKLLHAEIMKTIACIALSIHKATSS